MSLLTCHFSPPNGDLCAKVFPTFRFSLMPLGWAGLGGAFFSCPLDWTLPPSAQRKHAASSKPYHTVHTCYPGTQVVNEPMSNHARVTQPPLRRACPGGREIHNSGNTEAEAGPGPCISRQVPSFHPASRPRSRWPALIRVPPNPPTADTHALPALQGCTSLPMESCLRHKLTAVRSPDFGMPALADRAYKMRAFCLPSSIRSDFMYKTLGRHEAGVSVSVEGDGASI